MQSLYSIDALAYFVFVISIAISLYLRKRALSNPEHAKTIRSEYRHAWIKNIVSGRKKVDVPSIIRNHLTITVGLISGIIIAMGLALNAGGIVNGSAIGDIRILSIVVLLFYSLFTLILEARTLLYIPIIVDTAEHIIEKYEGKKKENYLSELLDSSFDYFSSSIRAILYVACLMVWFYHVYFFVVSVLFITFLLYREDFGTHGRITLV